MKSAAVAGLCITLAALVGSAADAQTAIDAYRQQCVAYGFQPGTPELAGCIQKLDMQQHQQACAAVEQRARYFCNGGDADTVSPVDSAVQCAQAREAYQAHCQ